MNKLMIIAKQVLKKNVTSFSWWSLVLLPLIIAGVMVEIGIYSGHKDSKATVAVVAPSEIVQELSATQHADLRYRGYSSKKNAERALKNTKVDGILTIDARMQHSKLTVNKEGADVEETDIQQDLAVLNTANTAKALGLSQQQLAQLLRTPELTTKTVSLKKGRLTTINSNNRQLRMIAAQLIALPMYIFLISYGNVIAQEIGTEKGSRIEESILTAVKAKTQFYGKLLGVGILTLIHLLVYLVVGVVVWLTSGQSGKLHDLINQIPWHEIDLPFLSISIGFFILGVFTYAILAALCGSLVTNQEQIAQAAVPATLIAMVGFFAAIQAPDSQGMVTTVLSYLPFTSPMVMPVRYGVDQASLSAAGVAWIINVIFLLAFCWLSANAYERNVLVYNNKGIFKALRHSLQMQRKRH